MDMPIKLMPYIEVYSIWKFTLFMWVSNITNLKKFILYASNDRKTWVNVKEIYEIKNRESALYSTTYYNKYDFKYFKIAGVTLYDEQYDSEIVEV